MNEQATTGRDDAISWWHEELQAGRLQLQYCQRCDSYQHYPRAICASCWHDDLRWQLASGEGQIYSYTVARVPTSPALVEKVPYVIAIVELAEGPRLTTNIVDCAPESVNIGMRVQAVYAQADNASAPLMFRPNT